MQDLGDTIADPVRIYVPLLKFLASSLAAFAIDTAAFLVLTAVTGSVLIAVAGAGFRPRCERRARTPRGP